jgi:hypothetical protein
MKYLIFSILSFIIALSGCTEMCFWDTSAQEEAIIADPPTILIDPPDAPAKEFPYKIAIYTDMYPNDPETISILKAEDQYAGRIIRYNAICFADEQGLRPAREVLIDETIQFISDPQIKVLVFVAAGLIDEPAEFLRLLKESRPDIYYIAVYCYRSTRPSGATEYDDFLMEYADLELSTDQKATAFKAVNQAKEMGAVALVDYTAKDHKYYEESAWELFEESRILPEVRSTIKVECSKNNIEYVDELGPNPIGDIMPSSLANWPYDKINDKIDQYGDDTCFISSRCWIQAILDREVFYGNGIIVQICHPSLLHSWRLIEHADIIDNENHFGDLDWTIEQMKSLVEKEKASGRFATWRVPFSMAATTAAVEYAIAYCEGEITSKTDYQAMKDCFQKAMETYNAGDIAFELNIDPEHANHFMFTQDYIVF